MNLCTVLNRNRYPLPVNAWLLTAALGIPLAFVFVLSGGTIMVRGETLDAERSTQLELGTVDQRAEVLGWLAEHGDQSTAHKVVMRLKDDDAAIRDLAEHTLWAIWMRSGNEEVDNLMQQGIGLMGDREFDDAVAIFSDIIRRKPEFAEGYNKRATLYYMMGEYLHSLEDVEATLKLNPEHFGALSGGGLCLLRLSRPAEALQYFDRALAVNPNMESIRFMAEQLRKAKPKPLI